MSNRRGAVGFIAGMVVAVPWLLPVAARAADCASSLPKDARTIYDATLPQMKPGADLRALVTASTRKLAWAGTIDRGSARASAIAAGKCLQAGGD